MEKGYQVFNHIKTEENNSAEMTKAEQKKYFRNFSKNISGNVASETYRGAFLEGRKGLGEKTYFTAKKEGRRSGKRVVLTAACAVLCILLAGGTVISYASGKNPIAFWKEQILSGNSVQGGSSLSTESINKEAADSEISFLMEQYALDENGFLYMLLSVKDEKGSPIEDSKELRGLSDSLSLSWKNEDGAYPVENFETATVKESHLSSDVEKAYGISVSCYCPELIYGRDTELELSFGDSRYSYKDFAISERGLLIWKQDGCFVKLSAFGIVMDSKSSFSQKINEIFAKEEENTSTKYLAVSSDGKEDALGVSLLCGTKEDGIGLLQFSPYYEYNSPREDAVWNETEYQKLLHSLSIHVFDTKSFSKLALEDGTVLLDASGIR